MKFARKIATAITAAVLMCGLTTITAAPSNADDTTVTTSVESAPAAQAPVGAQIYAKAANVTDITAQADSVSIAGANAMGKILLEEEKTQSPIEAIREFKPPSYDEVKKYGTWVYSIENAQMTLTKEVKVYDQIVKDARVKVAKLKLRIKHKDGNVPKLKKKLKKAKTHLRVVRTSWKFKPILRMGKGVCGVNSGRTDGLELQPFTFCVGAHNDLVEVDMAWVPEMREVVIAVIVHADGTVEIGCFNVGGYDVPPGTPDETVFLVLKAFAQAVAKVGVWYNSKVVLTVGGVLTCPGNVIVSDEKTVTKPAVPQYLTKEVTSPRSVEKAIAFGEEKARVDVSAAASATAQVSATYLNEVGATLDLVCPNQKPIVDVLLPQEHLISGDIVKQTVLVGDPEDGSNIAISLSNVTLTGPVDFYTEPGYQPVSFVEGDRKKFIFWIKARSVTQNTPYSVTVKVYDSKGDSAEHGYTSVVVPDIGFD